MVTKINVLKKKEVINQIPLKKKLKQQKAYKNRNLYFHLRKQLPRHYFNVTRSII